MNPSRILRASEVSTESPKNPARLKVLDEPRSRSHQPWDQSRRRLTPLPVEPLRAPAPPCLTGSAGPRRRTELPSLVPLDPELFAATKHPWAVRGIADLFKLFLPELSVYAACLLGSGVLATKMTQRLVSTGEATWVMASYGALLLIDLTSFHLTSKGHPYPDNKLRAQRRLLASALLFVPHLLAYLILNALK
jgi:hypothetical protein